MSEPTQAETRRIAEEVRDRVRFEEEALDLSDQVFRVARHLVGSREEAEDLMQETYARAYVSCIRSSASSREPTRCRATRKTWSDRSSASSSKRTRSRASSAMRLVSAWVGSLTAATLPTRLF